MFTTMCTKTFKKMFNYLLLSIIVHYWNYVQYSNRFMSGNIPSLEYIEDFSRVLLISIIQTMYVSDSLRDLKCVQDFYTLNGEFTVIPELN